MENLLRYALEYTERYIPVFPVYEPSSDGNGCSCDKGESCKSTGKHPRTKNGFKDATTDPEQVKQWWNKWPNANIGIPTGKATGWLVLDVDPKHGGVESLEEFLGCEVIPETLASETGSGGMHYIFAYPKNREIRGRANILPGLELTIQRQILAA